MTATVTAGDVRELLESRQMDPVLVRWATSDGFHTAGEVEVVSRIVFDQYSEAKGEIIVSQNDLRSNGSDYDPDNPTDEDCAALAEMLNA